MEELLQYYLELIELENEARAISTEEIAHAQGDEE